MICSEQQLCCSRTSLSNGRSILVFVSDQPVVPLQKFPRERFDLAVRKPFSILERNALRDAMSGIHPVTNGGKEQTGEFPRIFSLVLGRAPYLPFPFDSEPTTSITPRSAVLISNSGSYRRSAKSTAMGE